MSTRKREREECFLSFFMQNFILSFTALSTFFQEKGEGSSTFLSLRGERIG